MQVDESWLETRISDAELLSFPLEDIVRWS